MKNLTEKKAEVLELASVISQGPWFAIEYAGQVVIQVENFYAIDGDILSEDFFKQAKDNGKIISMVPDMVKIIQDQDKKIDKLIEMFKSDKIRHELPNDNKGEYNLGYVKALCRVINHIEAELK